METLRQLAQDGEMDQKKTSVLYNSLKRIYELTTDAPDNWEDAIFSEEDFSRRLEKFSKRTKDIFKNPESTFFAYKSRALRAVKTYEKAVRELSKRGETAQKNARMDEIYFVRLGQAWTEQLRNALNDEEKSRKIEVIPLPTKGSGFAALVISKDSGKDDLMTEYRLLKGFFENE